MVEGLSAVVPGSCHCGGVRFEVTLPFSRSNHCHCRRCQKQSGTSHTTSARARPEQIRLLAGEELLVSFRPAPGAGNKTSCSLCGSNLFGGDWPDGPDISVRLSALDGDPGIRPEARTFVAYKPVWYELPDDGLPRYEEGRP